MRTETKVEEAQIIFDIISDNLKNDATCPMPGEVAYYIHLVDDERTLHEAIFINTVGGKKTVEFVDTFVDESNHKELVFDTGGAVDINCDALRGLIGSTLSPVDVFEVHDFKVDKRSRLEDMFYLVRLLG